MTSRPAKHLKGRFVKEVASTNLMVYGDDFPEFEPFEGLSEAEAGPRTFAPGQMPLTVESIDMCQQINKPKHFTTFYHMSDLVVRRGQEFIMQVSFSRPVVPADDYHIEFLIGSDPSPNRGTRVIVTFGNRVGGPWSGRIVEQRDKSVMFGIVPTPNSIVGKYRVSVVISTGDGLRRTRRDPTTDMYLLFNAWCPDDHVFLADEAKRKEYVLNDEGSIYQGSADFVVERAWTYGQFEQGILDACIFILDNCQMPISDRGNIVKLVRKGSAVVNSQDDNGVLVGNWSNDYSMGYSPTSWTGSVKILQLYYSTHVPVCYAQCWVYAGVFNTFLRCLGIPARVISNFNSAHDNNGNLKCDLIFQPDGAPDRRATRDSIWNYHCWNECWIKRFDLPPGMDGWQVVDSTPQETSDGFFRCGPAPVSAIKEGILCHPFDCGFVFAEVNSDVVFQKRDRYGNLEVFKVDKTYIGKIILTKAVGSPTPENITGDYKYPEGSSQDEATMARAEEYGCERDHTEVPEEELTVTINVKPFFMGQDVQLEISFNNHTAVHRSIQAKLECAITFYTAVPISVFRVTPFEVNLFPNQALSVPVTIQAHEYGQLNALESLEFTVTGISGNFSVYERKKITPQMPKLTLELSNQPQVNKETTVTVSFTNPFGSSLNAVSLSMEGAGLMAPRTKTYNIINPQTTITWKQVFIPRLPGYRRISAVLDAKGMSQTTGYLDIHVLSG